LPKLLISVWGASTITLSSKEDILYLFYQLFIITYYQEVIALTSGIISPVQRLKVAYRTLLDVGFSLEDEILFGWTEAKNMKKAHLQEILRLELELVNYFKEILDEIQAQSSQKAEDTFMVANFLVYCATFGILRRWVLRTKFDKAQITDFLMNSQLKNILPISDLNFNPFRQEASESTHIFPGWWGTGWLRHMRLGEKSHF